MLRVVGQIAPERGKVTVEWYLPLDFRVPGSVYYTWVAYAPDGLLEVGVNPASASVREIALVDPGQRVGAGFLPGYAEATRVPGLPVIDVSEFVELDAGDGPPVIGEESDFRVSGNGSSIVLALNEVVVPDRCLRCDRAGFFVASGFLCGFGFFDLKPDEYALVVSSADRKLRLREEKR